MDKNGRGGGENFPIRLAVLYGLSVEFNLDLTRRNCRRNCWKRSIAEKLRQRIGSENLDYLPYDCK